jgi:oxaloacetate decarboxylase beta subunit
MLKVVMKKILLSLFVAILLFTTVFSGLSVNAASSECPIKLKEAKVLEESGKLSLKIIVENTENAVVDGFSINLFNFDPNVFVFNKGCFSPTPTGEQIIDAVNGLEGNSTYTFSFDLESCSDYSGKINLLISAVVGDNTTNRQELDILNSDSSMFGTFANFIEQTGFYEIGENIADNWKVLVMFLISFVLIYLAIVKKFEPLLLLPIAFGMLLTNLPGAEMYHPDLFADGHVHWELFEGAGLIDYLYLGVKLGIYPCLIFLGIGAMTDFGPLIANPKSLLLGAAAQLGIFATYFGAIELFGFSASEAASIGIIGGADGPTAIFVTSKLAPELLGPIAVAAYSYMALVPFIQPPFMKLLTTKKERSIEMKELRSVSKKEKMIFPICVTVFVALLVPSATPLVGCLMLGNLMRESGVVDRIMKAAQNELMNIVTIFLGISVGATATADAFLDPKTLKILAMGIVAFIMGTCGGILLAKFMNLFLKNKINPLIGSAGVSAVPMAARVSQSVGQKENPSNFLLMHAMGPNVAGVIGSAIAAGVLIALFA